MQLEEDQQRRLVGFGIAISFLLSRHVIDERLVQISTALALAQIALVH